MELALKKQKIPAKEIVVYEGGVAEIKNAEKVNLGYPWEVGKWEIYGTSSDFYDHYLNITVKTKGCKTVMITATVHDMWGGGRGYAEIVNSTTKDRILERTAFETVYQSARASTITANCAGHDEIIIYLSLNYCFMQVTDIRLEP